MDSSYQLNWAKDLADPTGSRSGIKPRATGKTMVIDKGLGLMAFEDLLETAGDYVDVVKIGFGTAPLYPPHVLRRKIEMAKSHGITIMPGGTFLEVAVSRGLAESYFQTIAALGFNGLEVSDGTIDLSLQERSRLVRRGLAQGLEVYTEYGKKLWGSSVDTERLIETVESDTESGASLVIVEGRESGKGVGIYDEQGECRDATIREMVENLAIPELLMWEAPLKEQQVHLIKTLGAEINLGNIAPQDIFSLEALRRGLRSDTFRYPDKTSGTNTAATSLKL